MVGVRIPRRIELNARAAQDGRSRCHGPFITTPPASRGEPNRKTTGAGRFPIEKVRAAWPMNRDYTRLTGRPARRWVFIHHLLSATIMSVRRYDAHVFNKKDTVDWLAFRFFPFRKRKNRTFVAEVVLHSAKEK